MPISNKKRDARTRDVPLLHYLIAPLVEKVGGFVGLRIVSRREVINQDDVYNPTIQL